MIQLPDMPDRIARLPRDHRGYPVPFFVAWIDGQPHFPTADGKKALRCLRENLCWVCGETLGRFRTFPIGPMSTVNRVSAEPPSHLECAMFSVRACPFLTRPAMKRQVPMEGTTSGAGIMLERNPGVVCVWTTRVYAIEQYRNGPLFRLGDPSAVAWFAEGREASFDQVLASVEAGLPTIQALAAQSGASAVEELNRMVAKAAKYFPKF